MPIVRRDRPAAAPAATPADGDGRAGVRADAVAAPERLCAALAVETTPALLDLMLAELSRERPDLALAEAERMLADTDPARRNKAVETLIALGTAAAPAVERALAHPSPDVRIQALAAVGVLTPAAGEARLIALLDAEADGNVCGAALEALLEIGTPASLPALGRLGRRFATDPALGFAIGLVRERIADEAMGGAAGGTGS